MIWANSPSTRIFLACPYHLRGRTKGVVASESTLISDTPKQTESIRLELTLYFQDNGGKSTSDQNHRE